VLPTAHSPGTPRRPEIKCDVDTQFPSPGGRWPWIAGQAVRPAAWMSLDGWQTPGPQHPGLLHG
jgi:hypothetical protein